MSGNESNSKESNDQNVSMGTFTNEEKKLIKLEQRTIEIVDRYLQYAFKENDFIIGLDRAGVFLFTFNGDDVSVGEHTVELCKDLDLEPKQITICVLNRKSKYNYCDIELLPQYLHKAITARTGVLNQDDVVELADLYGVRKSKYYLDFSETDLYRSLCQALKQRKETMPQDDLNTICREKVSDIRRLKQLNVPEDCIGTFINLVSIAKMESPKLIKISDKGKNVMQSYVHDDYDTTALKRPHLFSARKCLMLCIICAIIGALLSKLLM